ncbi:MAG: NAD(P)H-hydrate dehydratase [Nitrosomonas sp.]|nr:NAD(P)H-hydrate dehydratase [Nitrosomonas sp.]
MNTRPIYTTAQIREIESLVLHAPMPPTLMEIAGLAAAGIARDRLLGQGKDRVLVVAGPGNNGGDAFVVARYLKTWGNKVILMFVGDAEHLSQEAQCAMEQWRKADGRTETTLPVNAQGHQQWDVVIDGLFGIGFDTMRPLLEKYREIIRYINNLDASVLALDIPSGLTSDTGEASDTTIHATLTTTFIALKPGLLTHDGCDHCGEILVCDLGLQPGILTAAQSWLLDGKCIEACLPDPRPANSHKGTYGSVGILGGATGMVGAAVLAGRAALNLGAGRVYLGLLADVDHAPVIDSGQPELMLRSAREFLKQMESLDCLVAGPGLGSEIAACNFLQQALHGSLPLVLDADALNLIARHEELSTLLKQRQAPCILTPHSAEAARLLNTTTDDVQKNRPKAARELAEKFNCPLVLKGAGSICAFPNGDSYFNPTGNPGLSTAGTGDILSGFLGSLLAQGLTTKKVLLLSVYLHGAAADKLLDQTSGPIGMTASEIIPPARSLLNQWIYQNSSRKNDRYSR